MMEKPQKWCVVGAGMQGCAVVFDAVTFYSADVLLLESNFYQFARAKKMLESLLSPADFQKIQFRLVYPGGEDYDADMRECMSSADVVVSCAPHMANRKLAWLAMEAEKPYCDLGGSPETVDEQEHDANQMDPDTPVVPECGVSPGLTHILANGLVQKDDCDEIHIRCGSNPLLRPDPKENPWLYKLVFSIDGLEEEYSGTTYEIENGFLKLVRALSYVKSFDASLEWFPTSNNSRQVVLYFHRLGVRTFDYGTLRYHGHHQAVLDECGAPQNWYTGDFQNIVRAKPELVFDRGKDMDELIISVAGIKNGTCSTTHKAYLYKINSDPVTKFTGMEIGTSIGISTVAHQLVNHAGYHHGFVLPAEVVEADWLEQEINRRLAHYFPEQH